MEMHIKANIRPLEICMNLSVYKITLFEGKEHLHSLMDEIIIIIEKSRILLMLYRQQKES